MVCAVAATDDSRHKTLTSGCPIRILLFGFMIQTFLDLGWSAIGSAKRSEEELERELEVARTARVEDGIETGATAVPSPEAAVRHLGGGAKYGTVHGSTRSAEVGVIEHVEHFGLEAQANALVDGEIAMHGEVQFPERKSAHDVAPQIAGNHLRSNRQR